MPDRRPRTTLTRTPALERALERAFEIAARTWPSEPRRELLLRLIERGARQLEEDAEADRERRRLLVGAVASRYGGTFRAGHLDEIREGWPD